MSATVIASQFPGQSEPNEPFDPVQGQSEEPFPVSGSINPGGPVQFPTSSLSVGVTVGGSTSSASSSSTTFSPSTTSSSTTASSPSSSSSPSATRSSTPSSVISNSTKPTPSSTSTTPTNQTSITNSTSHNKNGGLIGGVVGGIVALLVIGAFLMFYFIRRSRRRKKHHPAHVTAFEVSTDKDKNPLRPDPHLNNNQLFVSDSTSVPQLPVDGQPKIGETTNYSSPDIPILQRDSLIDQSNFHPNRSSPELLRPNQHIISHNSANLNPLLREILNATQGRNQGDLDTGDPNVPQNIQIFIINQPSNTDGSGGNENNEHRGVRYGQSSPRNMDIDTLSLPPSYE